MRAGFRIDCHNHIIDPARFPFAPRGGYRPRPDEFGRREDFVNILDTHGVRHALLVQPSCYGTDNSAALDAIAWRPDRFKAIGVLDPSTPERELEALGAKGLVGVRFNLPFDPDALERPAIPAFLARIKALGWFVQVHGHNADWVKATPVLRKSSVRLVIDHMGLENAEGGVGQKGFQSVLELGRDTEAIIKLSAPFRASRRLPLFDDIDPFVDLILENFGVSRCIWGSDWPFLNTTPLPDYDQVLVPLVRWLSDHDRHAVLWDNPIRLFGFGGDVSR
jgi:predicted TIM-barrel fold metal-dependent hydrolase